MPNQVIRVGDCMRGTHLIWTGYGHWLPNDPRGSGSTVVRSEPLDDLGPVHIGRKSVQPARGDVRAFYQQAERRLLHPVVWFKEEHRQTIGRAIAAVVAEAGYTIWALAVLRNHVHAVVRTHHNRSEVMLGKFATATREALWAAGLVKPLHPVWSARMYKVFLKSDDAVRRTIRYVENNPLKEGLPPQRWDWVTRFDR
jgi:REP element-mobilizing transposase RayT